MALPLLPLLLVVSLPCAYHLVSESVSATPYDGDDVHIPHHRDTYQQSVPLEFDGMQVNRLSHDDMAILRKLWAHPDVNLERNIITAHSHRRRSVPSINHEPQKPLTEDPKSRYDGSDHNDGERSEKVKRGGGGGGKENLKFGTGPFQLCDEWNSGSPSDDLVWMEGADRLFPVLNDRTYYNMFMAPGQRDNEATNVSLAMYIESMSSFKAQTMDFEVDMYLALSWFDRRLSHNCTHAILVTSKRLTELIWRPDLYFVNSKFGYMQEVTTPNMMMLVYPDGMISMMLRVDVTLACAMELHGFPFDTQKCGIKMQSFAYVQEVVNLIWHVDEEAGYPIGTNEQIRLSNMRIVDRQWEYCSSKYKMFRGYGNWSCVNAFIVMSRLIVFHIIQTYVPTAMLVIISWLSFYLDPRAAPARISLTITTLLTLTTMSNGARQGLPQVSYIKALDIWLAMCTVFVFCVLLEYTLVSFYITRKTTSCHHLKLARRMNDAMSQFVGEQDVTEPADPRLRASMRAKYDGPSATQQPEQPRYLQEFIRLSQALVTSRGIKGNIRGVLGQAEDDDTIDQRTADAELDQHYGLIPVPDTYQCRRHSSTDTALLVNSNNSSTNNNNGQAVETTAILNNSDGVGTMPPGAPTAIGVINNENGPLPVKRPMFHTIPTGGGGANLAPPTVGPGSGQLRKPTRGKPDDVLRKPCAICAAGWEQTGKRIDKASRIVFPAAFTLFAVAYWAYYLCKYCRLPEWMPQICGDCYRLANNILIPSNLQPADANDSSPPMFADNM